ncbi:MAG TPA: hypothetical protein DHW78_07205 [Ruminococcaceae bacterium]|nr:hypothetical protein [Oscillospiraceae bacterium]
MATPENQAKIDWLNRYRKLDKEVDRKCDELSRWRSRATKITPALTGMPGGGVAGDRVQDAVEKIVALEGEINAEIDRLLQVRGEIEKAIEAVPDDTLRTLLELRYIDGLTWEKIAVKLNYSYMHICRLHGKAIQVIECYTKPVL